MAEEDTAEEAETEEEGGKKKSPLVLIIIIAVACLGIGLGGAYFMSGSDSGEGSEVADEATDDKEDSGSETVNSKDAFYFSLDPAFVVNFQGKGRARFLQVNIDGMTRIEKMKLEVTKHLPQIRNNVVLLLSSKSYEELITPEGKESLRKEVLNEIQDVMEAETGNAEGVENIFFTSFVMQ